MFRGIRLMLVAFLFRGYGKLREVVLRHSQAGTDSPILTP